MIGLAEQTGKYLSLIKFSHTVFALPFAIIGYFMGIYHLQYAIDLQILILVILCMVFARSAAMSFNRYVDRAIDAKNPRTAMREIPSRQIKPKYALLFSAVNSVLFIATTYFINPLCFYLSPVALIIVLGYSYTKRFTFWCHLILGLGLALAPIGAYIAVTGTFHLAPILMAVAVLFWVSGFDVIYALQDFVFDTNNNLQSIPVVFGKKQSLWLSIAMHFISIGAILTIGLLQQYGWYFWIGSFCFTVLLIYQHTLVKPEDIRKVNVAFFTVNGIASLVFALFFVLEIVL